MDYLQISKYDLSENSEKTERDIHRSKTFPFISLWVFLYCVWQRKTPFLPLLYLFFDYFFIVNYIDFFFRMRTLRIYPHPCNMEVVEIMILDIRYEIALTFHMILRSFYCPVFSPIYFYETVFFWKVPCFLSVAVLICYLVYLFSSDVRCLFSSCLKSHSKENHVYSLEPLMPSFQYMLC